MGRLILSFIPLAIAAIADQANVLLHSMNNWITHHSRQVAVIIGLIGVYLLVDGIRELNFMG